MMGGEGMAKYRLSNHLVTPCSGGHGEGVLWDFLSPCRTSVSAGPCPWALGFAMSLMERHAQNKHLYKASSRSYVHGQQGLQELSIWVKNTICLHTGRRSLGQWHPTFSFCQGEVHDASLQNLRVSRCMPFLSLDHVHKLTAGFHHMPVDHLGSLLAWYTWGYLHHYHVYFYVPCSTAILPGKKTKRIKRIKFSKHGM